MSDFTLPHHHGENAHAASLHKELMNTVHFSAVSHHLRSLAESGLLVSRRIGKEVYYKAAEAEQIRLLHQIVEQVMEITCPEKAVDF